MSNAFKQKSEVMPRVSHCVILGLGVLIVWGIVPGVISFLISLLVRFGQVYVRYEDSLKAAIDEEIGRLNKSWSKDVARFASGDFNYEVLERLGIQASELSDNSRTPSAASENDSTRIMEEMQQAVIVFNSDLIVGDETSDYASVLFDEEDIKGANCLEILYGKSDLSDTEKQSASFMIGGVFGMDHLQWKISKPTFPKETSLRTKKGRYIVKYSYFPRYNADKKLERIIVVTEDITEFKKAQDEVDRRHKEMEKIFSLIEVPDVIFNQYMEETSDTFDRIKNDLRQLRKNRDGDPHAVLERMFRDVHTIKGNSKIFNFEYIHHVAEDVEVFLQEITTGKRTFCSDIAVLLTEKIMEINEEIYSYTSLRRDIFDRGEKDQEQLTKFRLQWIKSLIHQFTFCLREPYLDHNTIDIIQVDLNRALDSFSRVSIRGYLARYDGVLKELAERLSKKVRLDQSGVEYQFFDSGTLTAVNTAMLHILRNCLDHGVELPEERMKLGKEELATIAISTAVKDHWITIEICDDGCGIDADKVALVAVANGVISRRQYENLSFKNKLDLIFASGLSTKVEVTDLSGRGVGMDAVRAAIRDIGGIIKVESEQGVGSRFVIKIPEKYEEFTSKVSVFDWLESVRSAWATADNFASNRKIDLQLITKEDEAFYLLGHKKKIQESLERFFLDLIKDRSSGTILCEVTSVLGQRDGDSFEFYRTDVFFKNEFGEKESIEKSDEIAFMESVFVNANGSVILREDDNIEINIPTSMPSMFDAEPVNIVMLVDDEEGQICEWLDDLFTEQFLEWRHKIIRDLREVENLGDERVLVVSPIERIQEYVQVRGEKNTMNDGFLSICGSEDFMAIDGLENVPLETLLAPKPVRHKTFCQMFEALLLRKFISEIKHSRFSTSMSNIINELKRPA